MRNHQSAFLFALALAAVQAHAQDAAPPGSVQDLAQPGVHRAQEYKDYKPAIPVYSDMGQVKRLADMGRARGQAEFQALAQQSNMAGAVAGPALPGTDNGVVANTPQVPGLVVLAVSSSMPLEMLRDYMAQLDRVPGAVVVLRGFVGGATKIQPSGKWVEQVLRVDPGCLKCAHRRVRVEVDPLVFRSLDIKQVPAVTYLAGVQELQHCEKEQFQSASVVYGAVSVEAALREVVKGGVPVPPQVLAQYRGKS